MKIGLKLPFALKNKRRNTNLKFVFKKLPFWTLEKVCFWFLKKTRPKKNSSCFGLDSTLKTLDAQMFIWSVFLKMHKKNLLTLKNAILAVFDG